MDCVGPGSGRWLPAAPLDWRGRHDHFLVGHLSLPEAAAYLGLSWWTTRELVMGGTISAVRLPAPRATDGRMLRRILIDVADLDRLISKWKDRSA